MSENEFLNALKEEMPESFGRELLAALKAEEKQKVKPFPAFWTVAAASIVTVLVGFVLVVSRISMEAPLSVAMQAWQARDPITPGNVHLLEPLLTIGEGRAQAIALSPDNNTLAVATTLGIYLHDAHDLDAAPVFLGLPEDVDFGVSYSNNFQELAYTPDGRLFILMVHINELRLYEWEASTQSFIRRYTLGSPWLVVQAFEISPDGSKMLLGTCSHNSGLVVGGPYCMEGGFARIQIVDLVNGGDIFFRMPRRMSNAIVDINPDWTLLVYEEESKIRLYDLTSEETTDLLLIGNANGNEDQVMRSEEMHRVYFSPDGSQIGIIDATGRPMDWWELSELQADTRTTRQYGTDMYGNNSTSIRPVAALNPVREQYAMASGSSLQLFNYDASAASNLLTRSESHPMSYASSSDGESFYSLDPTGVIRVWRWENLSLEDVSLRYAIGSYGGFSFSDDSNRFSAGYYYDGLGFAYDISGASVDAHFLESGANVYLSSGNAAISHDGRYAAFYQEYSVWLYDFESQSSHKVAIVPSSYTPPQEPVLRFREDGSLLMAQNAYGDIPPTITQFSPEELASGDVIYPLEGYTLPHDSGSIVEYQYSSDFSPDGTMLLHWRCEIVESENAPRNCINPSLKLYDTFTWEELADLATGIQEDTMLSFFFFSPDSQQILLSFCNDIAQEGWICDEDYNVLEIWNVADLATSAEPYLRAHTLAEANSTILHMIAYPDGSYLFASWDWDTQDEYGFFPVIIFWELGTDGSITELRRIPMRQVAFAPDGSYFLTGGDGQIELWGVPATVASGD